MMVGARLGRQVVYKCMPGRAKFIKSKFKVLSIGVFQVGRLGALSTSQNWRGDLVLEYLG
jgi:hypothetical protein